MNAPDLKPATEPEVLITGEKSKLPADIAALLDPAIPLPAGVTFFEKRYELPEMMRNLLIAIGLSCGALIVIPFGIMIIFDRTPVTVTSTVSYFPLGFGLVMALGAWMMFAALGISLQLRSLQKQGKCTRRGIFIMPTALVRASENDTAVIPPLCFRGLDGNAVKYFHNKLEKSCNLPTVLINTTPEQLHKTIMRWANTGCSVLIGSSITVSTPSPPQR